MCPHIGMLVSSTSTQRQFCNTHFVQLNCTDCGKSVMSKQTEHHQNWCQHASPQQFFLLVLHQRCHRHRVTASSRHHLASPVIVQSTKLAADGLVAKPAADTLTSIKCCSSATTPSRPQCSAGRHLVRLAAQRCPRRRRHCRRF